MLRMTAIICLIFASLPAEELRAAATDLVTRVAPPDQPFTRYLTVANIPEADRAVSSKVVAFQVNSLSVKRRLVRPIAVNDTLLRVDLRDYGWSRESWERMTLRSPYIRWTWVDPSDEETLRKYSGSSMAIVRADSFLSLTSVEPAYSDFLGLPKTVAELEAKFGVQRKSVKDLSLASGGAVLRSIVAIHNRQLERWPTITGYWWQSRDSLSNVGRQNVLDQFFGIQQDGQEFIWSLPNGLQAYALADAGGKLVAVVPPDIAQDSVTPFRDKQVRNGRSCVGCHGSGINGVDDVISAMIREQKIKLADYRKETIQAIEDFYLGDLPAQIKTDREQYAKAVLTVNGMTPEANASAYTGLLYSYLERPVDLSIACQELGISTEEYAKNLVGNYNATLLAIHAGQAVARDAWESAYAEMAKRIYQSEVSKK